MFMSQEEGDDFSQSLERMKESFLWAAAQGGNEQVTCSFPRLP